MNKNVGQYGYLYASVLERLSANDVALICWLKFELTGRSDTPLSMTTDEDSAYSEQSVADSEEYPQISSRIHELGTYMYSVYAPTFFTYS